MRNKALRWLRRPPSLPGPGGCGTQDGERTSSPAHQGPHGLAGVLGEVRAVVLRLARLVRGALRHLVHQGLAQVHRLPLNRAHDEVPLRHLVESLQEVHAAQQRAARVERELDDPREHHLEVLNAAVEGVVVIVPPRRHRDVQDRVLEVLQVAHELPARKGGRTGPFAGRRLCRNINSHRPASTSAAGLPGHSVGSREALLDAEDGLLNFGAVGAPERGDLVLRRELQLGVADVKDVPAALHERLDVRKDEVMGILSEVPGAVRLADLCGRGGRAC